jgi:ribose 5-phosphate isomerase B
MEYKKVAMAADHAGYELKESLKAYLKNLGFTISDFGTHSTESTDYPDYAHPMALAIEKGEADFGISVCGSGNGINMTVNKHQGIRAALCWNKEISELARLHNNANVCSLPARFISENEAFDIVSAFINTKFEGGRHIKRVEKIPC